MVTVEMIPDGTVVVIAASVKVGVDVGVTITVLVDASDV